MAGAWSGRNSGMAGALGVGVGVGDSLPSVGCAESCASTRWRRRRRRHQVSVARLSWRGSEPSALWCAPHEARYRLLRWSQRSHPPAPTPAPATVPRWLSAFRATSPSTETPAAPYPSRRADGAAATPRESVRILAELTAWQDALQELRAIQAEPGFSVEAIHYNIVLKLLGDAAQWGLARELFSEMERQPEGSRARPDNHTFSTLISCSVRSNEHALALSWVEKMASMPACAPDQITYSTIMHALSQSGQPSQALRVFQKMCDVGWDLDSTSYGTVLTLYANARQHRAALDLYRKMKESGTKMQEGVYNCMLVVCRNKAWSDRALEVLEDMRAGGVAPSALSHTLVLQALVKAGQHQQALSYLRRAKLIDGRADAGMFNVLLGACRQRGDLAGARAVYQEMQADRVAPDEATLRQLLSVLAELGDAGGVRQAQRGLEALGVPMDMKAYTNVVQGYGRAGRMDAVRAVVGDMREQGMEADSWLVCTLISLLTLAADRAGGRIPARPKEQDEGAEPGYQSPGTTKGAEAESEFHALLWCLEELNAAECWALVCTVEDAIRRGESESGIAEECTALLRGMDAGSQLVAANALMDLLWALGRLGDALAVWGAAVALGLYAAVFPGAAGDTAAPRRASFPASRALTYRHPLGRLDLRRMSLGAAHVALYVWLARLAATAAEGKWIPREVVVHVGRGSFEREGASPAAEGPKAQAGAGEGAGAGAGQTVRESISATLRGMGAPFSFSTEEGEEGDLCAGKEALLQFLGTDWASQFLSPMRSLQDVKGAGSESDPGHFADVGGELASGALEANSPAERAELASGALAEGEGDAILRATTGEGLSSSLSTSLLGDETPSELQEEHSASGSAGDGSPRGASSAAGDLAHEDQGVAADPGRPRHASASMALSQAAGAEQPSSLQGPSGLVPEQPTQGLAEPRHYWELDGFRAWSSDGWVRRCPCGEFLQPRKRKCPACARAAPSKEAFLSMGTEVEI